MSESPPAYILTGSDEIKIVNYPNYKPQAIPFLHSQPILDLTWNVKGDLLAYTAMDDKEINFCLLKQHNNELIGSFKKCGGGTMQSVLSFSNHNPTMLGSSGISKLSLIWDCALFAPKQGFQDLPGQPECATFNIDDSRLLVGCSNHGSNGIAVFDLAKVANKAAISYLTFDKKIAIKKICPNPKDANTLGIVSSQSEFCLMDMSTNSIVNKFKSENVNAQFTPIEYLFSPISSLLSIGAIKEKAILLCDSKEKKVVQTIKTEFELGSIEMITNGTNLLAGTANGTLLEYDLRKSSQPISSNKLHNSMIKHISYRHNQFQDTAKPSVGSRSNSFRNEEDAEDNGQQNDEKSKIEDKLSVASGSSESISNKSLSMKAKDPSIVNFRTQPTETEKSEKKFTSKLKTKFHKEKEKDTNITKKLDTQSIKLDLTSHKSANSDSPEFTKSLRFDEIKTAINRVEFTIEKQFNNIKTEINERFYQTSEMSNNNLCTKIVSQVNKDFREDFNDFYFKVNKNLTQLHLDMIKNNYSIKCDINDYQEGMEKRLSKLEEDNEKLRMRIEQLGRKKTEK